MPNNGYGQMSKLAKFLGVHSTLVSQILKEHKELTVDQAALVADFFGLNDLETEYFVLLVQLDRSGNSAIRKLHLKQLSRLKAQAQSISKRITANAKLTDDQKAIFYSDWTYSAVRQSVALPGIGELNSISEYLGLPRKRAQEVLDFLLKTGLCKLANETLVVGPASTHVESTSPWVRIHHMNWRQKAIQSLDTWSPDNLHYTSPMTLSKKDVDVIREKIIQFIQQVNKVVDPSPSETLYCLDLDWFQVAEPKF